MKLYFIALNLGREEIGKNEKKENDLQSRKKLPDSKAGKAG